MDFARAAEVLEGVQRAPGLGVAAAPAQVDLAAPDARAGIAQSRLRAARSWLYALGYLAEDHDTAEYDAVLSQAVRSFQREAGLVVDGWLGEAETWPRLQELIAFEHPLDPAFWGDSRGGPKPALARAVGTRLRLYGIAAPRGDGPALDVAVRSFFDLTTRLGAPRESLGLDRTRWLTGVLDHDRHLGAVVRGAGSGRGAAVLAAPDEEPGTVQALSLLLNMAKIELWLAQGARTQLGQVHRARRGADQSWVLPSAIRGDMKAYMDWIDEEHPDAAPLRQAYRAALRRGRPEQALVHFLRPHNALRSLKIPSPRSVWRNCMTSMVGAWPAAGPGPKRRSRGFRNRGRCARVSGTGSGGSGRGWAGRFAGWPRRGAMRCGWRATSRPMPFALRPRVCAMCSAPSGRSWPTCGSLSGAAMRTRWDAWCRSASLAGTSTCW